MIATMLIADTTTVASCAGRGRGGCPAPARRVGSRSGARSVMHGCPVQGAPPPPENLEEKARGGDPGRAYKCTRNTRGRREEIEVEARAERGKAKMGRRRWRHGGTCDALEDGLDCTCGNITIDWVALKIDNGHLQNRYRLSKK